MWYDSDAHAGRDEAVDMRINKNKNWMERAERGYCKNYLRREWWLNEINRLRNIRQGENETIRGYASRVEAYIEALTSGVRGYEKWDWFLNGLREPYQTKVEAFCPTNYTTARECAFQIENFQRDQELNNEKKSVVTMEEWSQSGDSDVDSIAAALGALAINWVKHDEVNKIEKIESDIKE